MAKKWEEIEEMMTTYNYNNCTSEYFKCPFHQNVGSTVGAQKERRDANRNQVTTRRQ